MLRIWQTENGTSAVAVRLEGRIGGQWVGELERVLDDLLAEGKRIQLDLSQVGFLDERGIRLIRKFSSRGAEIRTSSPFVAAQLAEREEETDRGWPENGIDGERGVER